MFWSCLFCQKCKYLLPKQKVAKQQNFAQSGHMGATLCRFDDLPLRWLAASRSCFFTIKSYCCLIRIPTKIINLNSYYRAKTASTIATVNGPLPDADATDPTCLPAAGSDPSIRTFGSTEGFLWRRGMIRDLWWNRELPPRWRNGIGSPKNKKKNHYFSDALQLFLTETV